MDYAARLQQETILKMCELGADVLASPKVQALRGFTHHGRVTRYEHSLSVCYIALRIAGRLRLRVDEQSMVRGALLHDYFLYDWHISRKDHRWHGFRHAGTALRNATRDFELTDVEQDVIKKHMFPLNPALPSYRETAIVSLADKICAVREFMTSPGAQARALWQAFRPSEGGGQA